MLRGLQAQPSDSQILEFLVKARPNPTNTAFGDSPKLEVIHSLGLRHTREFA